MSDELRDSLRFLYKIVVHQQASIEQVTHELTALTDALVASNSLSTGKLNEVRAIRDRQPPTRKGPTLPIVQAAPDKYAVAAAELPCAEAAPMCHAACCKMDFELSPQDVEEGIVRWDVARPFFIAHDAHGTCRHNERRACVIHEQRPAMCRVYDCSKDPRVWRDFDTRVPSAALCGDGDGAQYQAAYLAFSEQLEEGLRHAHRALASSPQTARSEAQRLLFTRAAWHTSHPYPLGLGVPLGHGEFPDDATRPSVNFGLRRRTETTVVRQLQAIASGAAIPPSGATPQ